MGFGVRLGLSGGGGVGSAGLGLKWILLGMVMLSPLIRLSRGNKCDEYNNIRPAAEVQEENRKIQKDASSQTIDVPMCLIKGGYKCLGIVVVDGPKAEFALMDKVAAYIYAKLGASPTPPTVRKRAPHAIKTQNANPALKKVFRDLIEISSRWHCVSGKCGSDDNCAPGPPSTEVMDMAALEAAMEIATANIAKYLELYLEAVKKEKKAAEKEKKEAEKKKKEAEKEKGDQQKQNQKNGNWASQRLSSSSSFSLLVLGLGIVLLAQHH
jgi:hypothetical protein